MDWQPMAKRPEPKPAPRRNTSLKAIRQQQQQATQSLQDMVDELTDPQKILAQRIKDQAKRDNKIYKAAKKQAAADEELGWRTPRSKRKSTPIWGGALWLTHDTPEALREMILADKRLEKMARAGYKGAYNQKGSRIILRDIHAKFHGRKPDGKDPNKGQELFVDWRAWRDSHGYGRTNK